MLEMDIAHIRMNLHMIFSNMVTQEWKQSSRTSNIQCIHVYYKHVVSLLFDKFLVHFPVKRRTLNLDYKV